jgi:hypothetical protein
MNAVRDDAQACQLLTSRTMFQMRLSRSRGAFKRLLLLNAAQHKAGWRWASVLPAIVISVMPQRLSTESRT